MAARASRRLLVALSLAVVAGAGPARAELPDEAALRTSSLSWVRLPGAESCIGTRALAEAVEARLRRRVILSAAQADLSIEGRVSPRSETDGGYRATVVVSSAEGTVLGERELEQEGEDCRALDEALVLVVALMIDPDAAMAPAEDSTAPDEPSVPEPETVATPEEPGGPEAAPAPPEERPRRFRADLAAGLQVELGALPGAALGPALSLVLDPARAWPIELELGALLGARVERDAGPGGGRFDQVTGRLLLCVPFEWGRLRVHGCLGASAGAGRAEGQGFDANHVRWSATANALGRVRALWNPWRWLVLRVGATLIVPFVADRFVFADEAGQIQALHVPWPVGVSFEAGLGVIIPPPSAHSSDGRWHR